MAHVRTAHKIKLTREEVLDPIKRAELLGVGDINLVTLTPEQEAKYAASPLASVLSPKELYLIDQRIAKGALTGDSPEIKQLIAKRFENDPIAFGHTFLKEHFKDKSSDTTTPSPEFHKEIHRMADEHNFLAIAAPRGHAKSTTVSFLRVIHAVLYKKKQYVVLVSASEDMAKRFLRRIRDELEFNNMIKWLFGEQKTEKWSETEIRTQSGSIIAAKGRGTQMRGLITGSTRPDLIICDDLEDDELVRSETRRQDLEDWFNAAVLPTLEPKTGQLIFIGTVLHMDSLLNRLLDPAFYPDFERKRYAALDENENALWPERFNKETLVKIKNAFIARRQLHKFFMEYMNDPVAVENADFKQEFLQYYNELPESTFTILSVDLGGGGTNKSSDPTAMVILAVDRNHDTVYVHDYVNERFGTDVNLLMERFFELYGKYKPEMVWIENTMTAKVLQPQIEAEMRRRGVFIPITYVTPQKGARGSTRISGVTEGKYMRITGLVDPLKMGLIKLRPWMKELVEQLLMFPRGTHDDIIDALAYGYQAATTRLYVYSQKQQQVEDDFEPLFESIGL